MAILGSKGRKSELLERIYIPPATQVRNRTPNRLKMMTNKNNLSRPISEIHHITNIVIQRNAATSLLDSITWLNRELAWIVIFLWLVALGIGATAAIVFALGLLNKATA